MSNPHCRATWIDRLLSPAEQGRSVRVLHDAGFRDASCTASIHGLIRGAVGPYRGMR